MAPCFATHVLRWAFVLTLALPLIVAGRAADAAEWYARSGLSQALEYDDNIGLSASERQRTSGFSETSTLDLNLGGRSPTMQIDLGSKFNFTRFPTESRLNSNDQFLTLAGAYTGQRATLGLSGRYVRDTTRTSDLDGTGLFILQNTRRQLTSVTPELAYKLTERDEVRMSGGYTDITYPSGNIRDYSETSGRFGWTHALSPRTQLLASASVLRVNSNSRGSQNSYIFGLLAGARHIFSPQFEATLVAGPSLARTDFVANVGGTRTAERGTALGYLLDSDLTYTVKERLSVKAGVSRTVTPDTTTGAVEEVTAFRLSSSYTLYPNVFADAGILYLVQQDVGQAQESVRRDYVALEPGVRWRFFENWEMALRYRFEYQTYGQANTEARANTVMASVSYRLPPLSMSR